MTQESTIPPSPPSIFQFRHDQPVETQVAPRAAPTMECVVETGIQVTEQIMRKIEAPMSAENMATEYWPISESQ